MLQTAKPYVQQSFRKCFPLFAFTFLVVCNLNAQTVFPLSDLSSFQNPSASWKIAGGVNASLEKDNFLTTTPGTGVLVNLPEQKAPGKDLFTQLQHGDADIEFDYLMAKKSNSGVYLQGRYEIQMLDSWGVRRPNYGDNGGIYERWDDARGKGKEGFEGFAPRQNVSRAPGLWQRIKISFQAPRFDATGKKTENAKILRAELNGVLIHDNVEMAGVTRGALGAEAATGPLRIQGDHGAVAIRNLKITNYDKSRPELAGLKYTVYKGLYENEPDYAKLPPEATGPYGVLSSNINNLPDSFLLRYTGTLKIKEPGEYVFNLSTLAGTGALKINNQSITALGRRSDKVRATLPAGDLPFELLYSKFMDWAKPSLGLSLSGPGIREYSLSDGTVTGNEVVDPILMEAGNNTVLRSFMDLPGNVRLTHSVNVGSPEGLHYTYDMDNGMLAQVWRGGFLDATPMWHERGDGSSRPTGSVQHFGSPIFSLAKLSSAQDAWIKDSTGTAFRSKGYIVDEAERPTFRFTIFGASATDAVRVLANGQGFHRVVTIATSPGNMFFRLAKGNSIDNLGGGLFLIDDKSYYIKMDDGVATPLIREANGAKELIVPVETKIGYSILL